MSEYNTEWEIGGQKATGLIKAKRRNAVSNNKTGYRGALIHNESTRRRPLNEGQFSLALTGDYADVVQRTICDSQAEAVAIANKWIDEGILS